MTSYQGTINSMALGSIDSSSVDAEIDKARFPNLNYNCFYSALQRHIPIIKWLPEYSLTKLQCDVISGVTIGLMVIPQGLAYASIARLPPQYGLFSAYMGCFVYCFFGSAKDLTIGPTSILSLMVAIYGYPKDPRVTVTFTLFVGLVLLCMGILRLGFLVKFVSVPVLSGFTSAAAITIAAGQLKDILGLTDISRDFLPGLVDIFKRIKYLKPWDLLFGVSCIVTLLIFKKLGRINWEDDGATSRAQRVARKFLWFLGIGRNTVIILVSMAIAYCVVDANEEKYLTLSHDIKGHLPGFKAPLLEISINNQTLSTLDLLESFDTGLLVVPILAFVEAIAVGKVFSRQNNYKIDPTQELIALGLANIAGSFVSSYPVTGSFSRSAVNSQSGVQTPLSGVFTAAVVMLAVEYFTPYFEYIPRACLGAIIIAAVLTMIDISTCRQLWKFRKLELIPLGVTFFSCFYTLEFGLLAGVLSALALVLYPVVYPKVIEDGDQVARIKIVSGVLYPGVEYVLGHVEDLLSAKQPPSVIILDFSGVVEIDYTFLHELIQVSAEVRKTKSHLYFVSLNTPIREMMIKADIGCHFGVPDQFRESLNEVTGLLR